MCYGRILSTLLFKFAKPSEHSPRRFEHTLQPILGVFFVFRWFFRKHGHFLFVNIDKTIQFSLLETVNRSTNHNARIPTNCAVLEFQPIGSRPAVFKFWAHSNCQTCHLYQLFYKIKKYCLNLVVSLTNRQDAM
jgi:hypothetical protein